MIRFDDILGRHGPSWAKRPELPVISNALPEPATSTAERADARFRAIGNKRRNLEKIPISRLPIKRNVQPG
jgi:hypothetical protein